jgi:hypothetical protein
MADSIVKAGNEGLEALVEQLRADVSRLFHELERRYQRVLAMPRRLEDRTRHAAHSLAYVGRRVAPLLAAALFVGAVSLLLGRRHRRSPRWLRRRRWS